jgi:hypothetical protein
MYNFFISAKPVQIVGKICAHLSTYGKLSLHNQLRVRAQVALTHQTFPPKPPSLSTPNFAKYHLLQSLFTHNPHPLLLQPPNKI